MDAVQARRGGGPNGTTRGRGETVSAFVSRTMSVYRWTLPLFVQSCCVSYAHPHLLVGSVAKPGRDYCGTASV